MTGLFSAAAFFVVLHLVVASPPIRPRIVRALGEGPYLGVFSLASLAGIVWLTRAYSTAYANDNVMLWWVGPGAQYVAAPIMLTALFLAVPGLLTPSPTAVRGEKILEKEIEPHGIQRVTRHPFLAGVTIWATFHLIVNGDLASVTLFATFLVVALAGMPSIDRKRARTLGDRWQRYADQTSRVPFVAILSGRTKLSFREIGWWRVVAALAAFAIIVSFHPMLFGAYPLPGMDD